MRAVEDDGAFDLVLDSRQVRIEISLCDRLVLRRRSRRHRRSSRAGVLYGRELLGRWTAVPASVEAGAPDASRASRWGRRLWRLNDQHRTLHRPFGARSPRRRPDIQRLLERRDRVRLQLQILPTGVIEVPWLQMNVREAPLGHLLHSEILRRLQPGRAGETRTVHVRHLMEPPHQLRVLRLLRSQLAVDVGQARRLGHRWSNNKTADRKRMYPVFRHELAPIAELSTTANNHLHRIDEYYLRLPVGHSDLCRYAKRLRLLAHTASSAV